MTDQKSLFCFGFGYTAGFLAPAVQELGWKVSGTTTDPDKKQLLASAGVNVELFDANHPLTDPYETLSGVTHLLLSVPPGPDGDIVFDIHGNDIAALPNLEWVGYLSTTGVYGNHDGNWVDENTPPAPDTRRGEIRVIAEQEWQGLVYTHELPLHIFRLSGIYGPGRSAIDAVRAGTARRIDKKDHVFNRIHIDDITQALLASMQNPKTGAIYNLSDDCPSSSCDVITFACNLLGMDPPPLIPFEGAEMAPIVRSFYKDNKRVRNDKLKQDLDVTLKYPDFRAGLQACLLQGEHLPPCVQSC